MAEKEEKQANLKSDCGELLSRPPRLAGSLVPPTYKLLVCVKTPSLVRKL